MMSISVSLIFLNKKYGKHIAYMQLHKYDSYINSVYDLHIFISGGFFLYKKCRLARRIHILSGKHSTREF
jgi:hypothetical protein